MKAKHFAKLRSLMRSYTVQVTSDLFGEFPPTWDGAVKVMARNASEACRRAVKRGYGRNHANRYEITTQQWAHWRVKQTNKNDHWRNISYRGN